MTQTATALTSFSSDPLIGFEEEGHRYTYDGKPEPGVNEVLTELGFNDFSMVPKAVLEFAQDKGKKVHSAIHLHLEGRLDWDDLDPVLTPYLRAFDAFLIGTGFKPLILEQKMRDAALGICGTPDAFGILRGREVLIDWKSFLTKPNNLSHRLATAAYDGMIPGARERYTLGLSANEKFVLTRLRNPRDKNLWRMVANLYHEKRSELA